MAEKISSTYLILLLLLFLITPGTLLPVVFAVPSDYTRTRTQLILTEQARNTGGLGHHTSLSRQELIVDSLLMKDKKARVEAARLRGADFPMNFLTSKADMESTEAFRIIRKMPKGALLHVHKTTMVSLDWVVQNVTYRPHLYMCQVNSSLAGQFRFADQPPAASSGCQWGLVSSLRANHGNATAFDQVLHQYLSLRRSDAATVYRDVNSVWDVFEEYFSRIKPLVTYTPVWRDYLWQALTEFLQDKVQYVEIRGSLPKLYELNGTVHEREWSLVNVYKPVFQQFKSQFPAFMGAKLILTSFRGISNDSMLRKVQTATHLYQSHPGLVVGFDIVGQEDRYKPLSDFVDAFMYPSRLNPPVQLPYYFHAGETVWQGTETDRNLVDALLLNTTRIGHGYALLKHPLLMTLVKNRDIALEISPISNQVLKLVPDLRNHPGAVMLASDLPLVISSDDPACWEALPLSHDFYLTFMAMLGENVGLATLKRLALNSIRYSAMDTREKAEALTKWHLEWDSFVADIVKNAPGCI